MVCGAFCWGGDGGKTEEPPKSNIVKACTNAQITQQSCERGALGGRSRGRPSAGGQCDGNCRAEIVCKLSLMVMANGTTATTTTSAAAAETVDKADRYQLWEKKESNKSRRKASLFNLQEAEIEAKVSCCLNVLRVLCPGLCVCVVSRQG